MKNIHSLDSKKYIIIKGAKLHNLKNVDVAIPRNKFIVFTGVSGSGKSSLVFDTLYAEGQRRYVESLSSYARQFLGRLKKPKVDQIKGIAPAIAIEQKTVNNNPRSTVGTKTEIYDYLKLLFARIGTVYSPSGEVVRKDTVSDVINQIKKYPKGEKILLLFPVNSKGNSDILKIIQTKGFARIFHNGEVININDALQKKELSNFQVVLDRFIVSHEEDFYTQIASNIELAFFEGNKKCSLYEVNTKKEISFSNTLEMEGITFLEPNVHLFNANNPIGACQKCEGYGKIIGIDPALVIPNSSQSVYEGAIAPWKGESRSKHLAKLVDNAFHFNFPIHRPYFELTKKEKDLLWNGNKYFTGINDFFKKIESKKYKIQNRVLLARYRGKTTCDNCCGSGLKTEALYVKIAGKTIWELVSMPLDELGEFFNTISLSKHDNTIAERLLKEIKYRIDVLLNLGLDYLQLSRKSSTLSGGESQRINLATSLGSGLVGAIYILDEPSIGLHPKDTKKLLGVLKKLQEVGNTVIVVEHEEEIIKAADQIIDMGPKAGSLGGEVVGYGTIKDLQNNDSLTGKYLSGTLEIETPKQARISKNYIELVGAKANNLKNINVKIPLNTITVITGVSGSGKTTLVKKILYPALLQKLGVYKYKPEDFSELKGDFSEIKNIEFIDQNPIGKSSRSNPVTYIKVFDAIRNLYAEQPLSKLRNYKPKHFSFNIEGGRCDTCNGEGVLNIEMQFMADVTLPCEVCNGKKFKKEILEIKFNDLSIYDILNLTVDDAILFFKKNTQNKIAEKLLPLQKVGLGYVKLGQSSTTFSGGEAQRIKLAYFIGLGNTNSNTLFIFDEPTTGLHFHDIKKLISSFNILIENNHSILIIEHNIEIIKIADYIIDLGPGGGKHGGNIVAEGIPNEIITNENSITGTYLKSKIINT